MTENNSKFDCSEKWKPRMRDAMAAERGFVQQAAHPPISERVSDTRKIPGLPDSRISGNDECCLRCPRAPKAPLLPSRDLLAGSAFSKGS